MLGLKQTHKVEPNLVQTIFKTLNYLARKTCHLSTTFTCTHMHNTKKTLRFVFQLSYHRKLQMILITNENIRSSLTYHCPSHWHALQRHTTTRTPPGININTCTEASISTHAQRCELGSSSVIRTAGQTWGGPLAHQKKGPHELTQG